MSPRKTTRLPATPCPYCGERFDAASSVRQGTPPKPGHLAICLHCAQVLQFTDGLALGKLSAAAWNGLALETKTSVRLIQRAVRSVDRRSLASEKAE